jgi:hypothetical protein
LQCHFVLLPAWPVALQQQQLRHAVAAPQGVAGLSHAWLCEHGAGVCGCCGYKLSYVVH